VSDRLVAPALWRGGRVSRRGRSRALRRLWAGTRTTRTAEPGVIRDYLAALRSQLPAPVVDELADGLEEARQRHLRLGLPADNAARAAVTEFGEPSVVIASFARVNPGRLTARSLFRIGPAVGGCWAAAGCIGTGTLDAAVVVGVMLAAPSLTWPVSIAAAASVTRIGISAKAVRRSLAE